MKKVLSLILAFAVVFSLCVTVNAEGTGISVYTLYNRGENSHVEFTKRAYYDAGMDALKLPAKTSAWFDTTRESVPAGRYVVKACVLSATDGNKITGKLASVMPSEMSEIPDINELSVYPWENFTSGADACSYDSAAAVPNLGWGTAGELLIGITDITAEKDIVVIYNGSSNTMLVQKVTLTPVNSAEASLESGVEIACMTGVTNPAGITGKPDNARPGGDVYSALVNDGYTIQVNSAAGGRYRIRALTGVYNADADYDVSVNGCRQLSSVSAGTLRTNSYIHLGEITLCSGSNSVYLKHIALKEGGFVRIKRVYIEYVGEQSSATGILMRGTAGRPIGGGSVNDSFINVVDGAEYDVTVSETGRYHISMYLWNYNSLESSGEGNIEVLINHFSQLQTSISATSSVQWREEQLGSVILTKGLNKLLLKTQPGMNPRISSLYITKGGEESDICEYTIYTGNSCYAVVQDNDGRPADAGLSDGASAWFYLDLPYSGYYAISTAGSFSSKESCFDLFVGDMSEENKLTDSCIVPNSDLNEETNIIGIELQQGNVPLILASRGSNNKLCGLKIIMLSASMSADALTSGLSRAESTADVRMLMEKSSYFSNSASALFYPDSVYARFCDISRELDLNTLYRTWNNIMDEVKSNPDVALISGGQSVTKPQKGNNMVVLNSNLKKGIVAVAAMYHANRLMEIVTDITNGTEKFLEFTVPVTHPDSVCKVLFFYNMNQLRPVDFSKIFDFYSVYVSPDGKDNASGKISDPFKTINQAKAFVRECSNSMDSDIKVNIFSGEYFIDNKLTFTAEDSGQNGYDIIYRGIGKTKPIISGGVKVGNNWTEADGEGIYKIYVPDISDARQMYINGVPAQRAKSKGLYVADYNLYQDDKSDYQYDGIITTSYDFPQFAHPEDLEFVTRILWSMLRIPVEGVRYREADDTVFCLKQPIFNACMTTSGTNLTISPKPGCRFYLENALEFLDESGEFYFDKRTKFLYYKPYVNEDLNTASIYLPKSEGLMNIEGTALSKVSDIRFENLDFRHGAYNEVTDNGALFFQADSMFTYKEDNQTLSNGGAVIKSQIEVRHASNIDIVDCNLSELGSAAIGMIHNVSDCEIKRNTIHDISATSIIVGNWQYELSSDLNINDQTAATLCNHITIENNIIKRTGQEFTNSPGLAVYYAKNINILSNDISQTPYSGITIGWGWGSVLPKGLGCGNHNIIGNKVYDTMLVMRDGGNIYSLGYLKGTVISENYLIGSDDYATVYLDNGTEYVTVKNNVCERNKNWWLYLNKDSRYNTVCDNYVDKDAYEIVHPAENALKGTAVYPNGTWAENAYRIIESSGVDKNLPIHTLDLPSYVIPVENAVPNHEQVDDGDYYFEAESYTAAELKSYALVESDKGRYTCNLAQAELNKKYYLEYTFDVTEGGTYALEGRISSGENDNNTDIVLSVDVNGTLTAVQIPHTNTRYGYYPSCTMGTFQLNQGSNTIRITNMGRGISADSFKLVKRN